MQVLSFLIKSLILKIATYGTSLVVQWLRLCTPNAGGPGSILGWGNKFPYSATKDARAAK